MAGVLKALVLNGTSPFSHRSSHFLTYSSVNVANRLTSSHRKPQAIPKGGIVIRANLQSNQANGSGDSDWAKPLMNFASKNFLPLALVGGVALGLANPTLELTAIVVMLVSIEENHRREKEVKKKEYEMYMAREQARIDAQKYHG
ncbi:hypothetical protein POM88_020415 [Heracleum sosnowskyi]|uniref:Uncharacterized protein n=1 Tax=Heracleum sosnowskyi TaxID=360622 RepID=A0AAD8MN30_9APIA|nr:hypothetical protein POM88_020415 [Heracleum sosnowskyi]